MLCIDEFINLSNNYLESLRSSHQHDPKEAEENLPAKAAGQGGDLKLGEGSGVVPPLPKFNPADTFSSSLKYIRNRPFLTKWWDLLDLSQVKKTFGSGLYAPWRGAYCYALIFFLQSVI